MHAGSEPEPALGTVLVAGKTRQAVQRHAAKSPCPKLSQGGLQLNPRFPPPPPPPGSVIGSAPEQGCAYTTGYADARKLKGAALIQPGLTNVDLFVRTVINENPKVNYAEFGKYSGTELSRVAAVSPINSDLSHVWLRADYCRDRSHRARDDEYLRHRPGAHVELQAASALCHDRDCVVPAVCTNRSGQRQRQRGSAQRGFAL